MATLSYTYRDPQPAPSTAGSFTKANGYTYFMPNSFTAVGAYVYIDRRPRPRVWLILGD